MKLEFKAKKSERGKRLGVFLHEKLETWSHGQIKKALDNNQVLVNGKNVFIANWNLKPNDRVAVLSGDVKTEEAIDGGKNYKFVNVLFEDTYLLVTSKPAFVDFESYVKQVNQYLVRINGKGFYPYLGQMHRLDKETTGILIFTKKKMANTLADQFRTRRVKKFYMALVEGQVEKEQGLIKLALEKGEFGEGKKSRVVEEDEGKEAWTEYTVLERYENATLVRLLLGTGRTHQIRVHMTHIGHPLLGDKIYGKNAEANKNTKRPGQLIKRQALHAWRVEFTHPVTEKKIKIEAPMPADMEKAIDKLRMSS